eukprot:gene36559-44350_t
MTLSNQCKENVRFTIPRLEAAGENLAQHFYSVLMQYPEVSVLFNRTHLTNGEQPRALAKSVLVYAKHLDQLDDMEMASIAERIINKHVSLGVQPEHYPIVGDCLLPAIATVIGKDVATEQIMQSWREAYQQLASILTAAEAIKYASIEQVVGGWRGFREFALVKKEQETSDVMSLYFAPCDNGQLLSPLPGQYIGLQIFINGAEYRRNYSLSQFYRGDNTYRVTVKKYTEGVVSTHLHEHLDVGGKSEEQEVFLVGSPTFMAQMKRLLIGVGIADHMIHLEFFGPAVDLDELNKSRF